MLSKKLLLLIPALTLTAACGSTLTVKAADPVVKACSNPVMISNLPELDQEIDNANNTNATNSALPIPKSMQVQLKSWAAVLEQLAQTIPNPGTVYQINFRQHLVQLAQVYQTAASSPGGYVTNETAVDADSHTNYITSFCANLRIAGS